MRRWADLPWKWIALTAVAVAAIGFLVLIVVSGGMNSNAEVCTTPLLQNQQPAASVCTYTVAGGILRLVGLGGFGGLAVMVAVGYYVLKAAIRNAIIEADRRRDRDRV